MMENNIVFQKALVKEKGITLVALVVTIVILIILSTVAINTTFGENELIKRAEDAKEMTDEALRNEEQTIANAVEYMNEILGGSGTEDSEKSEKSEVEEAIKNGIAYGTTTPIKDKYENTVYIPGGFKLAEDSGIAVEEGIVIEDSTNGNQFVWIPVGTYNVSSQLSETGTLINNLARRTFTSSGATEVIGVDTAIETYYYAEDTTKYTSVAKDTIGAFKTSTTTKGGFYIGRYEQGIGNVCVVGVEPYVKVQRDTANSEAKAMYSENEFVTSELISSYAWDTVLNYICQTNKVGYLLATTTSSDYGNIGTNSLKNTGKYVQDNYNNIHDMLGNVREWTTEYSIDGSYPCVSRGGYYNYGDYFSAIRSYYLYSNSYSSIYIGFRTQIWIS